MCTPAGQDGSRSMIPWACITVRILKVPTMWIVARIDVFEA
jgi:hypothetical protein